MSDNIFELATKQALRFPSNKGDVTVEQLWQMPLQSKTQFDLDTVAKTVNGELKAVTEESFVNTRTSPVKTELELKMEIVKYVIAAKLKENEDRASAQARMAKRDKLIEILDQKQSEALLTLTPEELAAQIAALS
jgi:hypothetical protein